MIPKSIFGHAVGREDSLKLILDEMYRRWQVHTKKLPQPQNDNDRRLHNRILATICSPGGGKTYDPVCLISFIIIWLLINYLI